MLQITMKRMLCSPRLWSRRQILTSLGFLAGALLLMLLSQRASPTPSNEPDNSAGKAALTVTTVQPVRVNLPVRLEANGSVAAWQEASLGSESSGLRLEEVRVNVGDVVRKGAVLAVFASDSEVADVAAAKASVAEAAANANAASADAARAQLLQSSGALSTQQIDQYNNTLAAARARLDNARASLAQQELRLQHTVVTAPDHGVISARSASVGAVVPLGSELFRLIRKGRLEWRAEVTDAELEKIRIGMPAQILSTNGEAAAGRVRMVAPTVDPQTRMGLVYVDLAAASGRTAFRAGMFARGAFDLGNRTGLTLPPQAVVSSDGFN